jgi:anti-sigma regulatory factor (Ser/Thr protein kinase)
VPLNLPALQLAPRPESVQRARSWVRDVLTRLERDDIVDSAELGVSELVTNALLHGGPPISVRVRGTRMHPRVEVRDGSPHPPAVNLGMAEEDQLLNTIGRGLGLMALNSSTWGAELTQEGKSVWFEPTDQPRLDDDLSGEVFDLDRAVQEMLERVDPDGEPVRIRILDLPLALYTRFRQRFFELSRELRLLSLAHGQDYPVARDLAEVFLRTEQQRRLIEGRENLDEAISAGRDRVDLDMLVPADMPETTGRLLDTLERADEFCRDQRLLTLAASPQQQAFQRWYLAEFVRQAAGAEPRPWSGSFRAEDKPLTG